jgi:hypothetical protein
LQAPQSIPPASTPWEPCISPASVITTYDFAFAPYIQAFVNQPGVATFFNNFLMMVDDPAAAGLVPVTKNAAGFAAFVQKYDNTNPANSWGQWYSAYPGKSVQNILNPAPAAS